MMKKLLLYLLLISTFSGYAQEGTKQLMPNEGDRLYLEMFLSGRDFATYGADPKDRLHIYLKSGETMHFGMKMNTEEYSWGVETSPYAVDFRIKDPDGNVVYPADGTEEPMFTSGDPGYISSYEQAVSGPNGVFINETEVTNGYNSETLTANQTGNYYIEFSSDYDRRFALEFFDVTVTSNDTVVTNPGEPNKSAGRLWSQNWALTNTSFTNYPVKVYFYVFTSDEFVNKIQYKMKPYSFNFVANPFGIQNSSSLNVIEKAQSQDGNQVTSDEIAEYKIYLNDPDRDVWKTTALPPPSVKVWHEDQLIYDYDYMSEPQEVSINLDTLLLEKNRPDCEHSSLTLFKIQTNVAGFTTILMDLDGNGYSTDGDDRVLHRPLKKGKNYILWNFRNDNGEVVSNGDISINATFYGRGATNFPLYDVETLSEVNTKTKRPFNKLCPTLYWDDSKISDWGDDDGTGSMDETDTTQLVYGNDTLPRVWAFNLNRQGDEHNGNMNTMNAWYNAIDLGRANITARIETSDTLCVNGSRPVVADVFLDTTKNTTLYFEQKDFTDKFSDPFGNELTNIEVLSLPDPGQGTLRLGTNDVSAGDIINVSELSNLNFVPNTDVTGEATFLWNGTNGTYYADHPDTVNMFINTPPDISPIGDTTICTDQNLEVDFTISDQDDEHDPQDIDVIAYSNNLNVVPNSGIEVTGSGSNRTLTVQPFGIQSGYTIIYLQAYDGVTSIIEQFAIKMSPSLDFTGDTAVCAGAQLQLTAVERGADSYTWQREGTVVETGRTYTDTELLEGETGTYTLTVEKGACVSSRDFNVSIYPIVSFSGDVDLCVGQDLELSADETTADEYQWRNEGYAFGYSKVLNIPDVETSDAGSNYSLYVRKEGCENTSDPFTVSVIENTDTTLNIVGSTVNRGENGELTIENSVNGIIYQIYTGDSLVNTAIGTGSDMNVNIPSNSLTIGNNVFNVTADNGNCIVNMEQTGTIHVNVLPEANDDNVTTQEDTDVEVDVLDNDTGLQDGGITISTVNNPHYGSITAIGDSTLTYHPDTDYYGNDTLSYSVCDVDGDCDTAIVYLTISSVDDVPVANDDNVTTDEDTPVSIDVLQNDTGLDDGLTVTVVSDVSYGTTSEESDNTITYTPNTDYNGADSFIYRVEDSDGDADQATVNISVAPVNDQPVANDTSVITNEDVAITVEVLTNDEGLGDGVQSVSVMNDVSNGSTQVNPDHSVTYNPAKDFSGTDSYSYEVTDADDETSSATVSITVNEVDDQPIANDTTVNTTEDTQISIDVLANDEELGDGGLSVDITGDPTDGSTSVDINNQVTYTPDTDYYGTDNFTYRVTDANGSTAEAVVTVNVSSVNDEPVAKADNMSTDEDVSVTKNVLINDEGLGDGGLIVSIISGPAHGDAIQSGDSSITYTPESNYYGSDTLTYQICDENGSGECDEAIVTISINSVDDSPKATDDNAQTDEDVETSIDVLDNDSGLGDGGISLSVASNPSDGSVQVTSDSTFNYIPNANFHGEDSFSYRVCDGDDDCDVGVVLVTVNSVNDEPLANDDDASSNENVAVNIDVLLNDEGLGDGDLVLTIDGTPTDGSATVESDNTITYDPDTDFIGSDSFTYQICDQNGNGECDVATVDVTIDNTDDIPVAVDDNVTINEDTDTTINVLANDQDLNDGNISVSIVTSSDHGSTAVNANNTIDYIPEANFNGSDFFEYEVCDVDGDCDTAAVNMTIQSINDIPVAVDDELSTEEDTEVTFDVLSNDKGLGDGNLQVSLDNMPSNGNAVINSDTTITYTPDANYFGSEVFSYAVCDENGAGECDTAEITINVTSVDDQPVANTDAVSLDEDTDITIDVLTNDSGLGDGGLSVSVEEAPDNGSYEMTGNQIVYTPVADYFGADTLVYQVCDGDSDCDTSRILIDVVSINDIPVANVDELTLKEDTDDTLAVLNNDTGLGDGNLTVTLSENPNHGTSIITSDNQLVYQPEENYNGSDQLVYNLCDGENDCDTALVNIQVESVDDQPQSNDDTATVVEDNQVLTNVLTNDSGLGDGIANLEVLTDAEHGTLQVVLADSSIRYTPEQDYNGTDQYIYRVTDNDGDYDNATVHVMVEPANDQPVAVDDEMTLDEDTKAETNVLINDSGLGDGGLQLTIPRGGEPTHGTAKISADSTIEYIPEVDFYGSDSLTYQICDEDDECATAKISVTVNPVDDVPVANNDTVQTKEDIEKQFNLLTNDSGLGDGGLSITVTSAPQHGDVEIAGDSTISYTPDLDYYGQDSLIYQVSDTDNQTASAEVFITINSVNDYHPIANDDERGTEKNTPVDINVLFNDKALGDGNISVLIDNANEPVHGTVNVTDSNTVFYTPDTDFLGDDSLVYQVYDRENDVSSARVIVHVKENNAVPDANADNATTHKNTQRLIDVLSNDTNLDDGGIEVTEWIAPLHGSITAIDSNMVTYLPDRDYTGTDRFTYLVTDAEGDYDTASVFITITDDNNILPLANADLVTTLEDTEVTYDVLANDDQLDDGIYTFEVINTPVHGTVLNTEVVGSQGNITYLPALDYYGTDSLIYQVCDLNNDCDQAQVIYEIEAVNDYQPVAINDSSGTSQNTPVTVHVLMNDTGLGDGGIEISEFLAPAHGTLTNIGAETVEYTPDTDYLGYDNFEYQITDFDGDTSEANVEINVRENNLVPVANADIASTPSNTSIDIDVLANDVAGDTDMADMKVTLFEAPDHGSVDILVDSRIEYTPDSSFTVGIDTLWYKIDDIDGDWDTASVAIVVYDGYNHKPDAFNDTVRMEEDTDPVFIDVLENDTALQDQPVRMSIRTEPQFGEITSTYGDTAIAYKPVHNYFGKDFLTYRIRDINGDVDTAVVYLNIQPIDDGIPNANDDSTGTSMNTPVEVHVLMNDVNLEDSIRLSELTTPSHGSITVMDSSILYEPDTDYLGRDEFEYQISDVDNQSDEAKVIIEVRKNNIIPVANPDSASTLMNQTTTIHVLRNDSLLDDGVGKVSLYHAPQFGSILINTDNTVEYMPDEDYVGEDEFVYKIDDEDGDWDTATVSVTVDSIPNYIPEAVDDYRATAQDQPVEVDVLANDLGLGDTPLNVWIVQSPQNGTAEVPNGSNMVLYDPDSTFIGRDTLQYAVFDNDDEADTARLIVHVKEDNLIPLAIDDSAHTLMNHPVAIHVLDNDSLLQDGVDAVTVVTDAMHGELRVDQYNTVVYEPYKWYTGMDEFTYRVTDSDGDMDEAKVTITIEEIPNYIPHARNDSTGTKMDQPVTINVLLNDTGLENGPISLTQNEEPEHGAVVVNSDNSVTYTPESGYLGYDTFTYKICDYDDECDSATVKVNVKRDNLVPVANDDSAQTLMNEDVAIHVLHNDSLLQDGIGALTVFSEPHNGDVSITNNVVTYSPKNWFVGPDRFKYMIEDSDGDFDTASVWITVKDVPNYTPVARNDSSGTNMNEAVTLDVLSNDEGLQDTPLTLSSNISPLNGQVAINEDHTITYTPDTDYLGRDSLEYKVCDDDDECDSAWVYIRVKENNLNPIAVDDSAHTLMNHDVTVHVLNNDSQLEDGVNALTIYEEAAHGELYVNQYNSIVYEPYRWYIGTDQFKYRIEDADGDYDTATVWITVEEIPNYIPLTRDDSTGTSMNETVTVDVLRNDEGLENGPISLVANTDPDHGSVTVNSDNTISYEPDKDYLGYDYFEYKVCDYDEECDSAIVKIHVRENNTVPVALDDKVYTYMNTDTTIEVLENDYGLDDGMGYVTIAHEPSYGTATVNSDYSITYSPYLWFAGPDTLIYELSDVDGDFDTAKVIVGVMDTDEPIPGVDISYISGNTSENNAKAHFNLALETQPTSDVQLNMSSTDLTEGKITKHQVTFTSQNWDREQAVTITGVDDNIVDGDILYTILTDNAVSTDPVYNNLTVTNVDLVNEDNDKSGIEVTLESENNRTSESGDKVNYSIRLITTPIADIVINASSTDASEGVVDNNPITFKPADSEQVQELVVSGVDDSERDGDIDYEVEFLVSSDDTSYNNKQIDNVKLVNQDNDEIETFVPEAFSPDGDGMNERFRVVGIDQYDNLSIKIYNRWGSLVFSDNDYQNNWDGKANVTTLGSKELPSGIYYYYLKVKDTGETFDGSVFLKR